MGSQIDCVIAFQRANADSVRDEAFQSLVELTEDMRATVAERVKYPSYTHSDTVANGLYGLWKAALKFRYDIGLPREENNRNWDRYSWTYVWRYSDSRNNGDLPCDRHIKHIGTKDQRYQDRRILYGVPEKIYDNLARVDDMLDLEACVKKLEPTLRRAFCLKFFGYSDKEIAEECGCTRKEASKHCKMARHLIIRMIFGDGYEEE